MSVNSKKPKPLSQSEGNPVVKQPVTVTLNDRGIRWRGDLRPGEREAFISRHGVTAYLNLPYADPAGQGAAAHAA